MSDRKTPEVGSLEVLLSVPAIFVRMPLRLTLAALPVYGLLLPFDLLPSGAVSPGYPLLPCIAVLLLAGFYAGPVGDRLADGDPPARGFLASGTRSFLAALPTACLLGAVVFAGLDFGFGGEPGVLLLVFGVPAIPLAARERHRPLARLRETLRFSLQAAPGIFAFLLATSGMAGTALFLVRGGRLLWERPPDWVGSLPWLASQAVILVWIILSAVMPTALWSRYRSTEGDEGGAGSGT